MNCCSRLPLSSLFVLIVGVMASQLCISQVAHAATANGTSVLTKDLNIATNAANGATISYTDGTPLTFPGGGNRADQVFLYNRPGTTSSPFCRTGFTCASTGPISCSTPPPGCGADYTPGKDLVPGASPGAPGGERDVYNSDPTYYNDRIYHGWYDVNFGTVSVTLSGLPTSPTRIVVYMPFATVGTDTVTLTADRTVATQSATVDYPHANFVEFLTAGETSVTLVVGTAHHDLSDIFVIGQSSPTSAPYARLRVKTVHGMQQLSWRSSVKVLGFYVYAGDVRISRLVTSTTRNYLFYTRHALAGLRLVAVPLLRR